MDASVATQSLRLVMVTLCAMVATLVVVIAQASAFATDNPYASIYSFGEAVKAFVFLAAFISVVGALPTILIGIVLIAFRAATPARLVAVPALLFATIILSIAIMVKNVSIIFTLVPGMAIGAVTMFWLLTRRKGNDPRLDRTFD